MSTTGNAHRPPVRTRILDVLSRSSGWLTSEAIAARCGVSRASVATILRRMIAEDDAPVECRDAIGMMMANTAGPNRPGAGYEWRAKR